MAKQKKKKQKPLSPKLAESYRNVAARGGKESRKKGKH